MCLVVLRVRVVLLFLGECNGETVRGETGAAIVRVGGRSRGRSSEGLRAKVDKWQRTVVDDVECREWAGK